MARSPWLVELIKKNFAGRFLIAELTKAPLLGNLIERWLFEGDDLRYLPADRVIEVDEPLDSSGQAAMPSRLVDHFIERAEVHWLMNRCICRDASHCKDYPVELGCLFLGEAALGIHPSLGRRVTKEQALQHARKCRDANLVHLIGRNKLDTVWLGVGPGDRLLTICNCCPCCCLWRMLPNVSPSVRSTIQRMPGVTVAVTDRCQGCGTCTQDVCFVNAIELSGDRAVINDSCVGCGRCASVCPNQAIVVTIDDRLLVEKAIDRISSLVKV